MTHTTTTIAMRISKPPLTHTSLSKLVFVINFFTFLRAAWLLSIHLNLQRLLVISLTSYQLQKFQFFSIYMAPVQSKDTNSKIPSCSDSRYSKNQILAQPKSKGSSIGSLLNLSMEQIVAVISLSKTKGHFSTVSRMGSYMLT